MGRLLPLATFFQGVVESGRGRRIIVDPPAVAPLTFQVWRPDNSVLLRARIDRWHTSIRHNYRGTGEVFHLESLSTLLDRASVLEPSSPLILEPHLLQGSQTRRTRRRVGPLLRSDRLPAERIGRTVVIGPMRIQARIVARRVLDLRKEIRIAHATLV